MDSRAAIIQYVPRPGIIDLGWGHPLPELLPVELWSDAGQTALRAHAWQALTYGAAAGPGPFIEWLAEHLDSYDQGNTKPSEVFVTNGASHGLALAADLLTEPGDVVLVDSPTYHLAFPTIADRRAEIVAVPTDDQGVHPGRTAELRERFVRAGRRVPMMYIVPTFANPTGRCLPQQRRLELVDLARRTGLTIVEDDTYRELAYDTPAPPSLWSLADRGSVVRLGTVAKSVAPGLRLGWITAEAGFVRRLTSLGYVNSGGGVNHTTALTMAAFGASGAYRRHVSAVRRRYAVQRDALIGGLRRAAPDLRFSTPAGGWFLWVELPEPLTADMLAPVADAHGVAFVEGARFFVDSEHGRSCIRLAFSMLPPDTLAEAARRLGQAVRSARADATVAAESEPGRERG
ncbi:aminotransferase-like domain-containing protein [Catellatospora tritici]|uniref:aminotransferase-like domain-containing protein n=1 Tax=Catellatospora tritici TaxID=2851566 RepID=UPI001C2D660F|nr:PLP-dependent aminotransferase family protein [Catellatospora tritici]MBV1850594.1 PLP-dependent aminotransferase family protein [Catellatospora tritici]